jgi:primosomal protein N'
MPRFKAGDWIHLYFWYQVHAVSGWVYVLKYKRPDQWLCCDHVSFTEEIDKKATGLFGCHYCGEGGIHRTCDKCYRENLKGNWYGIKKCPS